MGLHSRSNGTLWKVLCFRSTGFHQNTGRQLHKGKMTQHFLKSLMHVTVYVHNKRNLQNLFCSLTWCLQTLSPPLGSGNEALLHPPLPVGQILWLKNVYGTKFYSTQFQYINLLSLFLIFFIRLLRGLCATLLTLWMVDKCGDPEVGNFGDQFWPLLKERLAEFVVFLFYFEDLLTGLLVQPSEKKKIEFEILLNWHSWLCVGRTDNHLSLLCNYKQP